MSTISYPEHVVGKNISEHLAKAVILLVISLSLFWFSNAFPFFRVFEPQSTGWVLWASYAKDLIQPFAFYFFLCLGEKWLKTWQAKALAALAIPIILEIGQGLYYQLSPSHYVGSFDPLDIVMYIISVMLAVLVERKIFARLLKSW